MSRAPLPVVERISLRAQALLGWAAFAFVGPIAVSYLRIVRGHRLVGVAEARRTYAQALSTGRPTLVCANHLTMIDSVVLHHALAPLRDYLVDFRRFAWNLPAVENFTRSSFLRAVVYLGKCIPVDRAGDAEHHRRVLDAVAHLVTHGEVCTIFPEGGRSRTGRVEPASVTYGVGHLLRDLERPLVVCVYLRGEHQATWGSVPERGDTLHISAETIEPTTKESGLRASRDLARQVIGKLASMEEAHFASRRAASSGNADAHAAAETGDSAGSTTP